MIQEDDKIILYSDHVITLNPQNYYLINVGSVGQPRDFDSRSCYAIYDPALKEVALVRVPYDYTITQRKILQKTCPRFWRSAWKKGNRDCPGA